MDNNKRRIVIGGAIAAVIITAIILAMSGGGKPTPQEERGLPDEAEITIDKDTGSELINVPGKDEEYSLTDEIIVLGGDDLINKTTMTYEQYDLIIEILTNYAKDKIGNGKIAGLKFIPTTIKETVASDPGDYKVQVKTVGPENTLEVIINLLGLQRVRVYVTNTSQPKLGTYDSGILPDPEMEEIDGETGDVGNVDP